MYIFQQHVFKTINKLKHLVNINVLNCDATFWGIYSWKKLIFRTVVPDKSPPSQNCFKVDIRIYTETCLTFFFESFNDTLCINQLCKHSSVDVKPAYLDIWFNTWTLNDVLRFPQKYSLEFKMFKSLTPNIKWILGEVQISA